MPTTANFVALKNALWPDPVPPPPPGSHRTASLLPMYAPGGRPRPGTLRSDGLDVDSHWHFHDMHQLLYAFEGAIEVESDRGRHLVPRQLAAWIPAGVPHRASLHLVRSGSVFFTPDMLEDTEGRVRTVIVSALMREMMAEAMRWPLHEPDSPLRTAFFGAMAKLCGEWIAQEADLFLPTINDARLKRALDYAARRMDAKLSEACHHAGISERSLRRHLKAETGMTWEAYRLRSRMLQAVSLLSETDRSISDIAGSCGFDSPSAFGRAFRLTLGEAPRDYRGRVRSLSR